MKKFAVVSIVVVFAIISGIAGYGFHASRVRADKAEAILKQNTDCGIRRLGSFDRGDILKITEIFRGEHNSYVMLFPASDRFQPHIGDLPLGVGASFGPEDREYWQFDAICTMRGELRVIHTDDSPEWDEAVKTWAQHIRLANAVDAQYK